MLFILAFAMASATLPADRASIVDRPQAADGWVIDEQPLKPDPTHAKNPARPKLTTIATAPVGALTLGRSLEGRGSVSLLRDGRIQLFAEGLGPVHGLEWVDDTLIVVHGSTLSLLGDVDGDARAETRADLLTGLAPDAETGHGPSAVRSGPDGYLYIAIGDRGIPRAVGKDGRVIQLRGGGVVRVRPDGTHLEVVSTGEYRPRSLVITPEGDVLTLGPADLRGRWPASLTHHVSGGHFGYPYQFLAASFRCLRPISGEPGGAGNQGVCYAEDGLPERFRGNLFFADPVRQCVLRDEIRKAGGSFVLRQRTSVATKGLLDDFRPIALATTAEGDGFWIAEESGRIHRLTYTAADAVHPGPRPALNDTTSRIRALDHPAVSVRRAASRALAREGATAIPALVDRLRAGGAEQGRIEAIWALDAIDRCEAGAAIAGAIADPSPLVRIQAARSCGNQARKDVTPALIGQLSHRDPAVRREAAIALGRIGDRSAMSPLVAAVGDPDRFAAWSIRVAIRRLGYPETAELTEALLDPRRRENALTLADESWSVPAVQALAAALERTPEPQVRGQIIADLAAQYRRPAPWDGSWWGPDPLAGKLPRKTEPWDEQGMGRIVAGLRRGLVDPETSVRLSSILALGEVGPAGLASLRQALVVEKDSNNRAAIVEAIASQDRTPDSAKVLARLAADPKEAEPVRSAAIDGLAGVRLPDAFRARLGLVYAPDTPPTLIARVLPSLTRDGALPLNEIPAFFEHPAPAVRAAALLSLNVKDPAAAGLAPAVLARLDDPASEVREAAMLSAAALHLREAIPSLLKTAADPAAELRPQAIRALCRMPDPRALALYKEAESSSDPALRRAGAEALKALAAPRDPEVGRTSAREDERSGRVGFLTRIALRQAGDSRKGSVLFFENRGLGCASCHSIDGKGAEPGPGKTDLTNHPARGERARIIASVLEPTGAVAAAHAAVTKQAVTLRPAELTDLVRFLHKRPGPTATEIR
ncbi:HEAT repeat domain-containing protein [Aquisphaera insulae]|uniref:HEAT repeat domain-containing protein n=1 Tax=Aquisphaera insulae TaxID=2712864 RepID=UPI0013EA3C37|nr:HEAT repeat domain-containing protein [Aquisphaera insulae]